MERINEGQKLRWVYVIINCILGGILLYDNYYFVHIDSNSKYNL